MHACKYADNTIKYNLIYHNRIYVHAYMHVNVKCVGLGLHPHARALLGGSGFFRHEKLKRRSLRNQVEYMATGNGKQTFCETLLNSSVLLAAPLPWLLCSYTLMARANTTCKHRLFILQSIHITFYITKLIVYNYYTPHLTLILTNLDLGVKLPDSNGGYLYESRLTLRSSSCLST